MTLPHGSIRGPRHASSSAPPVLSSPLTNGGARISVAHIVMPAVNAAYRVTQARHALWLARSLLARTPLCWQLLLADSCTNTKYVRSPPDVFVVIVGQSGSALHCYPVLIDHPPPFTYVSTPVCLISVGSPRGPRCCCFGSPRVSGSVHTTPRCHPLPTLQIALAGMRPCNLNSVPS
ncbi:hypothetical protein K466DRAFT_668569 [Polyporus arcularius HHB13444]|uniref:Uncharacterized protein n=1 Tax=Polyporus arcularius HHB13444 TaxID=1314778 RepID=A0A5C3NWR4_9APHY|nr:hypothetical protein K466DRAFT_668569 [Polyporus arcularius HHB13444]